MIIDTFEWFLPFKEYSVENTMEHEGNGGGWGEEAVKLFLSCQRARYSNKKGQIRLAWKSATPKIQKVNLH